MTDRELLKLAAKAAGIKCDIEGPYVERPDQWAVTVRVNWNPLESDAEAFRLAVKLGIGISFSMSGRVCTWCSAIDDWIVERYVDHASREGATRRAITRAAAEIGRSMP